MKYPTQSALLNHYLQSILPNAYVFQQKQVPKNKDFYQPQKCIWNIPHRASSRIYPYYHKFNDDYTTFKQPLIKQLQQSDRKSKEDQRIFRLIKKRHQTRNVFYGRKQKRLDLQEKSKCHSNNNNTNNLNSHNYSSFQNSAPKNAVKTQLSGNQRTFSHKKYIKTTTQPNQQQPNYHTLNYRKSQRVQRLEQSYQSGVLKSIKKQNQIENLIHQQRKLNHDRIKGQFDHRRYINKDMMTKIKKISRNISYKV